MFMFYVEISSIVYNLYDFITGEHGATVVSWRSFIPLKWHIGIGRNELDFYSHNP